MALGSWGRFLVLVAGGSLVILAVVIVACFTGPGCWGFEYLHRERNKKIDKIIERIKLKPANIKPRLGYYWLENDQEVHETGQRAFEPNIIKINESPLFKTKENIFNIKCTPLLVAPNMYLTAKTSAPKLDIKLSYSNLNEDNAEGRVSVEIISASFLPCREYNSTLDPFVTVEMLNNKWTLQKSERIVYAVQTKVVKNSLNPKFDETFAFGVKKIEIRTLCLKFTVSDDDRLTKVSPLFERRIFLKDLKNLTTGDPLFLSLEMQEVVGNLGALFFGISYLPTAQRLNISVVKASKLRYQSFVPSLIEFYPYVRVVMINNHGKCIKRKKTCFKHKDENPVFNHSLVFDLSISNLEQTVFLVLLCTKALCQFSDLDDSPLDEDVESSLKESKDKVLGSIVLGRNVRCTKARDHWVTVMQNPRKMISLWHDLR